MSEVYRLSFLSFDALPLLDPSVRHGIGGAEVRAVTFARGLRRLDAERGARYAFNFIVRKPDRGPTKRSGSSPVNSKSILAGGPANPVAFPIHYYEKSGTSFLGKLTNSIAKRLGGFGFGEQQPTSDNFFAKLQSDVLLCFGIRNDTAKFVRAAKESGKRSVVFLTSDRNIDDAMRRGSRKRGVYGEIGHFCRYALMNADCVVTQSAFQQQQLQERLQIESHLIRNPIELDRNLDHGIETTQAASAAEGDSPQVLWVGRADTFSKRADLCLEVAKRCPMVRFKMVMNNHDEATFDEIQGDAPTNVEIIEHVPFREVESHFAASTLLLNTSSAEGFPNSFLQAAKYGKPIVSLSVDPGEMLSTHGCGFCAGDDVEQAAAIVRQLCSDLSKSNAYAQRAIDYVRTFHRMEDRCAELDEVLSDVLGVQTFVTRHAA